MPVNDLGEFCKVTRPNLVILSCSRDLNEEETKLITEEYARIVLPICPILAGGSLINSMEKYFTESGIETVDSLNALEDRLKRLSSF